MNKKSINFETLKPDNIYETLFDKKEQQEQDKTKRIKQLFNYYPQDSINDDEFNRNEFDPPSEFSSKTSSFICKCTQLKFELDCEPIFAQMALYDLKNRKKISESFHFDLNSEHIKYMLRAH